MRANESKYQRIVNDIVQSIEDKSFKKGTWIPSVNEMMKTYNFSRDTVFAGLRELKARGIIESKPGVGYYIASTRINQKSRIFLLFNELNAFKEDLYNSFLETMGNTASIDIFFHHYNRKVFTNLIADAKGNYTNYVIMPGKFSGIKDLLQDLGGQVYLIDHINEHLSGIFPSVYQNFRKDTLNALESGISKIKRYKKIIMVQRDEKEPVERFKGVVDFCKRYNFKYKLKETINEESIRKGWLYIIVNDRDLVRLIKQAEIQKYKIGKDFGVISCNEAPLKEIIAGGIATLSTDFKLMGKTLAQMIKDKRTEVIENPWQLNIRNSL
jgi:DNA-binding transcriptional regulator YhcF (GntR family)